MTETLTPPAAHSPLGILFDLVTANRPTEAEERDNAATAAADHI